MTQISTKTSWIEVEGKRFCVGEVIDGQGKTLAKATIGVDLIEREELIKSYGQKGFIKMIEDVAYETAKNIYQYKPAP